MLPGSCNNVTETFNSAFLAGTPDIAEEILDFTYKMPMWLADLWTLKPWTATDTTMQQLVFRGSMPEVERGFERWKKLASSAGCEPCVNDCSYNFTTFQGHGFNRQLVSLMRREFKTDDYCVNEIRSAHEFEQTFAKIIQNIEFQVAFFKENNIGLNFLSGIAKKLLIDSSGIKGNLADPYSYRPKGTAVLSKLNFRALTRIYEGLRRRSDVLPFDIQNGKPLYALSASDELIDDLYIADANARADLRFSDGVDALLNRYNFMSSIRGQFINAPLLYPRRFEWDETLNDWIEIYPYINGIPAEVGEFSDLNPAWENATYEEALVYGKDPFTVYYRDPLTTIGSGTEFGPEPSFMNTWLWVNIQTEGDMFRRVGRYATSIEMALAPQYSGGIYGIMFPRPQGVSEFFGPEACPEDSIDCDNDVPDVGCPCPAILSAEPSKFTAGLYVIQFAVPVSGMEGGTVLLTLDNGATISGTLGDISTDMFYAEVQFAADLVFPGCDRFVGVACVNGAFCDSIVLESCDCRSGVTDGFKLILDRAIKADTAGDIINAYMADGTVQDLEVVSIDPTTSEWTVQYAAGFGPTDDPTGAGQFVNAGVNCDRGGVLRVCVPTATDAACSGCPSPSLIPCS